MPSLTKIKDGLAEQANVYQGQQKAINDFLGEIRQIKMDMENDKNALGLPIYFERLLKALDNFAQSNYLWS